LANPDLAPKLGQLGFKVNFKGVVINCCWRDPNQIFGLFLEFWAVSDLP
jgi:hypothetical protein